MTESMYFNSTNLNFDVPWNNADKISPIVLKDELVNSMRLCGATDVDQLGPGLLNTRAVDQLVMDSEEHPYIQWKPKSLL